MIEAIKNRKSVRKFQDRKVEPEKVENILRAAMQAPSGMNGQPWEFVVVDDADILEKMKKFSMGAHALKAAPMAIVVLKKKIIKRELMGLSFLSAQDMGACTENLWLQAVEEGLGASWMGVTPDSKSEAMLSELLNLPKDVKAFAVMAIGYPAEDVDMATEMRYDEKRVHYNKY